MCIQIKDTRAQDVLVCSPKLRINPIKITIFGALLLIFVLVFSIHYWLKIFSTDRSVSRSELRTEKVVRGDFRKEIAALGRVIIANSPTLYSSADGVVSYSVKAGDIVKKNQILLAIDSPILSSQLQQEKSTLNRLQSGLAKQKLLSKKLILEAHQLDELNKINYETARRSYERYKIGYKDNFISRTEFEKYEDKLALAKLKMNQSPENMALEKAISETELQDIKSQLERQKWVVDELERRTRELIMYSPVNGIVATLELNQKSAVTEFQPLITVVDLSRYEAEIEIPEYYVSEVAPNMAVDIKLDGKNYKGKIITISPEIIEGQVNLRLDFIGKAPENLRKNQRISANILLELHPQVLHLPRGNYLESHQGQHVFVIDGDKAKKTKVGVGAKSLDRIEITEGLKAGDEVIISDTSSYKDANLIHLNK